jgi:spermidine/putrescine transport system permease protein
VLGVVRLRSVAQILRGLIGPAFAAGAVVAFVVSLDDFAVTYFLTAAGEPTFPITIFGRLNKGLNPEHFAAATCFALLNMSLIIVIIKAYGATAFGLRENKHENRE